VVPLRVSVRYWSGLGTAGAIPVRSMAPVGCRKVIVCVIGETIELSLGASQ
jgi:hypothetical protein